MKKLSAWACQMDQQLRRWCPGRHLGIVADSVFASLDFLGATRRHSRQVLSWRVSNSMEAVFCVQRLEDALRAHGKPQVFNTDQGAQFTSEAFTSVLKREGVIISMDCRGRAFDNIFVVRLWRSAKHEDVYLKEYATMGQLLIGLRQYFTFYKGERPYQALKNLTPDMVHQRGEGGDAMIVDNYSAAQGLPIALRSTGTAFDEV